MHQVVQMLETLVEEVEVLPPEPPACYVDSSPLIVSSV